MRRDVETLPRVENSGTAVIIEQRTALALRTPEQTALIALRGLLEAKEAYIQRLEVSRQLIDLINCILYQAVTVGYSAYTCSG